MEVQVSKIEKLQSDPKIGKSLLYVLIRVFPMSFGLLCILT